MIGWLGRSDHQEWWSDGVLHRDNGPAVDSNATGEKKWYRRGKLHRDDGPAIERADGEKLWYRHGEQQDHVDAGEEELDEDLDIAPQSRGLSR